jgi:hypothetical protein
MRKEHWKGKPFVIKYLALKLDKTHFLQIKKNSLKNVCTLKPNLMFDCHAKEDFMYL